MRRPPLFAILFVASVAHAACASDGPRSTPRAAGLPKDGSGGGVAPPSDETTASTSGEHPPPCPYEGPPLADPADFPTCPSCAAARCVPIALVPVEQLDTLADCDAAVKCVPDEVIATAGNFVPASCASLGGFEGRCLSICLPDVAALADLLPQDDCPDEHRCVPCYEPFGGQATGACTLSCDPGPAGPAQTFDDCCGGMGSCVPTESVPADQVEALGEDTCATGHLCAPDALLDGTYVAQACETSKLGPGACMPACLAALDHPLLKQDGCPEGFKCAPCTVPPDGEETGVCDYIR